MKCETEKCHREDKIKIQGTYHRVYQVVEEIR
jgi:hypothetical protein